MTKKKSLAAAAERFYVIEQMTMVEIAQILNVHEKTIQNKQPKLQRLSEKRWIHLAQVRQ